MRTTPAGRGARGTSPWGATSAGAAAKPMRWAVCRSHAHARADDVDADVRADHDGADICADHVDADRAADDASADNDGADHTHAVGCARHRQTVAHALVHSSSHRRHRHTHKHIHTSTPMHANTRKYIPRHAHKDTNAHTSTQTRWGYSRGTPVVPWVAQGVLWVLEGSSRGPRGVLEGVF